MMPRDIGRPMTADAVKRAFRAGVRDPRDVDDRPGADVALSARMLGDRIEQVGCRFRELGDERARPI